MKLNTRTFFFLFIELTLVFSPVSCQSTDMNIDNAKKTVFEYFEYFANNPYKGHAFREDLLHPDYVNPGVEGIRMSVITKPITIIEAKKVLGNFNLIHPHKEEAIEITAQVKQLYFVIDVQAQKDMKDLYIHFVLSNYNQNPEKYLILSDGHTNYNFVFEDAMRAVLINTIDKNLIALRASFIKAGMQGLGN
jgi:hypothetical protein